MSGLEENQKKAKIEKESQEKLSQDCRNTLTIAKSQKKAGNITEAYETVKSLIPIIKTHTFENSLKARITCQAAIYLASLRNTPTNLNSINQLAEYYKLSLKYISTCDDSNKKLYLTSAIVGLCHAKLMGINLKLSSYELKDEIISSEDKIIKNIHDMNSTIQAINKHLTINNSNIDKNLLERAHCSQYCLQYYCAYLKIYHAQLKEKEIKQDIQDIQDSSNSYSPNDMLTNKVINSLYIESFKLFYELSKNTNNFGGKSSFHLRSCFMHLVLFNILQEKNIKDKDKSDEGIELSKRTCKELNIYSNTYYLHDYLPLSDRKDKQGNSLFMKVIADL